MHGAHANVACRELSLAGECCRIEPAIQRSLTVRQIGIANEIGSIGAAGIRLGRRVDNGERPSRCVVPDEIDLPSGQDATSETPESIAPRQLVANDPNPVMTDVVNRDVTPLELRAVPRRERGGAGIRQCVMRVEIETAAISALERHLRGVIRLLADVSDHIDVRQPGILRVPRPAGLHRPWPNRRHVDVLIERETIGPRTDIPDGHHVAADLFLDEQVELLRTRGRIVDILLLHLSFRMRGVVEGQRRRDVGDEEVRHTT